RWLCVFFFFSSRRRHTRFSRDWSSDVCSSDLERPGWNGEYYRYLPDLRLRCLLVLARYAAGWTDGIRPADVEAIPDTRPTAVLRSEERRGGKASWSHM